MSMRSTSQPNSLLFSSAVIALLSVGVISRTAPLLNNSGRLLRQFPSEDGYLMLTIARNLALGKGMSTANGLIPTNGTQPLFNFMEALGFWAVGGNKEAGVAIALVLQVLFGIAAAWLLFSLASNVLRDRPYRMEIAATATALWYSSSIGLPHTMNCLETGLYVACILLTVLVWYRYESDADGYHFSWIQALKIGGLLGLTVWARIDAVFLIAAITSSHVLLGLERGRKGLLRRFSESCVMGLTAVAIASPWLIHNKIRFGSFTPISGTAQSHFSQFAGNLVQLPSTLFEYMAIILPIPASLEKLTVPLLATSIIVLSYLIILGLASFRMAYRERVLLYAVGIYVLLLIGYYGFLFGAPHFIGRYFYPSSPFLALFTASLFIPAIAKLGSWVRLRNAIPYVLLSLLMINLALNVRLYKLGTQHMHFQVVSWIQEHVNEGTWVGAVQTGTLGFFHDRTVNLDGKVNPDALAAKLEQKIPSYVVNQDIDGEGGKIDYLADWVGIASWADREPLDQYFELIVEDPKQNLAILQRVAGS